MDNKDYTIQKTQIEELKSKTSSLAERFLLLTQDIGHEELSQTAKDVLQHITEPYLFVIVGEVKAGKSSFINALLETDKEICKVAPSPMTDTIQQITYGDSESEEVINPYLKKLYYPIDILKEISIVDTPGTNTIIDHHQEITERFIPSADLIVFVFEAKNPYRESAWNFFNYINKEWWKNVIFILQQKDLMEPKDLEINRQGVFDYAQKKGIPNPQVFCVSAKMESEDKPESGFAPLRKYIDAHLLGGKAPLLKQRNNLTTLLNIEDKLSSGLAIRKAQYEADLAFRTDIKNTLDEQAIKTTKQVDNLVDNLSAAYQNATQPTLHELREGLGIVSMLTKSIKSTFGSKDSPKQWLEQVLGDLETELNTTLKAKLDEGVLDIADSIQQMGRIVDLKIRNSKTILRDDHEIFSDIAEKRAHVLRDLQQSFANFLNHAENFYDRDLANSSNSIAPNLAAASGITAVGVILAAVTNGMVFDITGGLLTAGGLLFASISLGFKRRKILRQFSEEIEKGQQRFYDEVSLNLKSYVEKIKGRIDENFHRFDDHLAKEGKVIEDYNHRLSSLKNEIINIQQSITL